MYSPCKKSVLTLGVFSTFCVGSLLYGQCCGVVSDTQAYQVRYGAVSTPIEVKTYKKEVETQYREETITSYKTVWDTVQQTTRVARQVPETSMVQETYKVLKPVWTTELRDESYDVTRYVPETSEREEKVIVSKPVIEIENREITETVRKPVQQTVMQEKRYTVQRPVTTYSDRTVDKGGYVDSVKVEQGKTYNRLTWQSGGSYLDPVTGESRRRLPGLYWTPMTSDPKYSVEKVYKPNVVTEQVATTSYKPETVVEQVPVDITTYQNEQITRIEPVKVQRMVQEEVVKKIPVKTYKPITERVPKFVPVQVCKMEEQEVTREIPRTTYKTVFEEQVQDVKVPRQVKEVRVVQKPVKVERWVPVTKTISASKPISTRLGVENEVVDGVMRPREDSMVSSTILPQATYDEPRTQSVAKPETIETVDPFALPPVKKNQ